MDMDGEMYSKLWGKQSELRKKKKGIGASDFNFQKQISDLFQR